MDVTIIDAKTGEIVQRPFTAEERLAYEEMIAVDAAREAERLVVEEAKTAAKSSALAKLAALGLTEEEAQEIVGA